MNSKSINRNVWALTLSLCLGVIFTHATGYAAEERKGIAEDMEKPGHGPSLRCCECVGKTIVLDLRTGIDPWTVSPGSGPTKTTLSAWTASAAPASWIQPVSPVTATASKVPAVAYKYTVKFNVPKCTIPYEKISLTGNYAADNSVTGYLDTNPIANCLAPASNPKKCFQTPSQPLTAWTGSLTPGTHTLTFDVKNEADSYSGLLVNAQLKAECKK